MTAAADTAPPALDAGSQEAVPGNGRMPTGDPVRI